MKKKQDIFEAQLENMRCTLVNTLRDSLTLTFTALSFVGNVALVTLCRVMPFPERS